MFFMRSDKRYFDSSKIVKLYFRAFQNKGVANASPVQIRLDDWLKKKEEWQKKGDEISKSNKQ